MSDNVGKKLIVRPTVAGFGVVVADSSTCDGVVYDVGTHHCVDLTPGYEAGFKHGIGDVVAYSVYKKGRGKWGYYTVDPGTIGT